MVVRISRLFIIVISIIIIIEVVCRKMVVLDCGFKEDIFVIDLGRVLFSELFFMLYFF